MIQDYLIAICNMMFMAGMIPQAITHYKLRRCGIVLAASIPTTLALYVLSVCLLTLGLYVAGVVELMQAFLWTIVLAQRLYYKEG